MRQTLLSRWEGALLGCSLEVGKEFQEDSSVPFWRQIQEEGVKSLATTGQWKPSFPLREYPVAEVVLLGLPLMLFFSDQPQEWQEGLNLQHRSKREQAAIVAYGTVIEWSIEETLTEKTLFSDLQTAIGDKSSNEVLQMLQSHADKGKTLQETKAVLAPTCQDLWLALYCLGTSLEDLPLSVGRAKRIKQWHPLVLPLVGALSGIHNSINAIPIPWRCRLQEEKHQWKQELLLMLATWSGSYEFAMMNQHLKQSAIAPAKVIQTRNY